MTIHFPAHIVPTPCTQRTFRTVLARREGVYGTQHGAVILEATYSGDITVQTIIKPFPEVNAGRRMPFWTNPGGTRRAVASTRIR